MVGRFQPPPNGRTELRGFTEAHRDADPSQREGGDAGAREVPSALPRFEPWPPAEADNPWRKETKRSFRPPPPGAVPSIPVGGHEESPPTTRVSEPPPSGSARPALTRRPRMSSDLAPRAKRRSRELEDRIAALPNRTLLGRGGEPGSYELGDPIAIGGTGAVYAAIHIESAEPRAVKLLYPKLARDPALYSAAEARFLNEARAQERIQSPHVVRIFDASVSDELELPYIVMERLVGDDLGSELERRARLPPPEVVGYLKQLASVLDEAHAIGVVHRDLKPANLFATLSPPPRPEGGTRLLKVLDFGIARITGADAATEDETPGDTTLVGTPWYMSPEQASGRAHDAGPASDRWALGVLAFRLLTGVHYWSSEALDELIHEILRGPVEKPSRRGQMLGSHFDAWFEQACATDPAARFPTAAFQIQMLSRALADDGLRVWVPSPATVR